MNLVQNGSFETFDPTFATLPGWNLVGGAVFYGTTTVHAADGRQWIALGRDSVLSQSLRTVPNQEYGVSFAIRGPIPIGQEPPFGIRVFWDSLEVGSFQVNEFSSNWVFQNLIVTAPAGVQTQLEFRDLYPTFVALDAVVVQPVPEPRPIALLAVAVAALAWHIRGRRSNGSCATSNLTVSSTRARSS